MFCFQRQVNLLKNILLKLNVLFSAAFSSRWRSWWTRGQEARCTTRKRGLRCRRMFHALSKFICLLLSLFHRMVFYISHYLVSIFVWSLNIAVFYVFAGYRRWGRWRWQQRNGRGRSFSPARNFSPGRTHRWQRRNGRGRNFSPARSFSPGRTHRLVYTQVRQPLEVF
jgi:hypothetical protein